MLHPSSTTAELTLTSDHRVIILNRGSMFAFQWREVYPSLSRVTLRCDVAHSGRENLHQFLSILLWRHALSSSIMTLWLCVSHQSPTVGILWMCFTPLLFLPSSFSLFWGGGNANQVSLQLLEILLVVVMPLSLIIIIITMTLHGLRQNNSNNFLTTGRSWYDFEFFMVNLSHYQV